MRWSYTEALESGRNRRDMFRPAEKDQGTTEQTEGETVTEGESSVNDIEAAEKALKEALDSLSGSEDADE